MIPKIIHQVWGGEEQLPNAFGQLAETWKRDYPKYRYEYWDDDRMNHFVEQHYPQYVEKYYSFTYHIQRWDAIRYMLLHQLGGMYVDFDYESLEPLDEIVKDKTCCFAMEPESHCRIFKKPVMFNNALMLSVPGHPFMQKIIETVFCDNWQNSVTQAASVYTNEKQKKNYIVLNSTSPWMLIDLYWLLSEKERDNIYLIPDKYVTPFDVPQANAVRMGVETEALEKCLSEAYAVHYFTGLWKNDKP